ncbi:MAG: sugar phosphate isomerase/epimerase family protein [Bacteroidales bacterium]
MSNSSFSRRSFLKAGTLGLGLSTLNPAALFASPDKAKVNDFRIKLSLSAYSFVDHFRNDKLTMTEFIDYCDKLKLDGTELTSYFFESEEDSYLLELRNKCFHLGLPISGTAIGNDFITPKQEERQEQVESVKYWVDKAAILGAPSIRVFGGGTIPDGHSEKDAYDWVIPALKECVDYASQKGIVLAIENHGGFPTTSEQVIKIIQEVDSPWFGANLDTGNFADNWYRQMMEVAPYSVVVQLKVNVRSTVENGKPITADAERIVRMLKNEGYRRYIALEYEEDTPYEDIPVWIDKLRECIG